MIRNTIEYYNQNAETFVKETLHADMDENRKRFLKYVRPGGKILDAGCGSGRDALAFRQAGYQVDAFDASEEICRLASENLGFPVRCLRFQELEGEAEYDGIWACASLLHVPGDELPNVIQRLKKLLKPGGILYASFKKGEGDRSKGGRYFQDMTEEKLKDLFETAGLIVLESYESADVREDRKEEKWVNGICSVPGAD